MGAAIFLRIYFFAIIRFYAKIKIKVNGMIQKLDIFRGAKVLVTGHTGFKGTWLSLWLAKLGARVIGLSLDIPTEPSHFVLANVANKIDDLRMDVRDGHALKTLVADCQPDFVFHLAAQALVRRSYADPIETWQTNVLGTLNVLEALRNLNNPCVAIIVTSDKCYDNVEWTWGYRENDRLGGADPYSASKGAAELAIRSHVQSFFPRDGMVRIGIGRAGNVIGGGDWAKDRIVPDCISSWILDEAVRLRNPMATRPWQHVLEPLSGYIALAMDLKEYPRLHGEAFNFGPMSNNNHTVADLVRKMSMSWGKVKWFEDSLHQQKGPYEAGLLKLNCDKALHNLQWRAVWDFDTTASATTLWYREFYENKDLNIDDFTFNQISQYVNFAKSEGLAWAM